MKTANEIWLGLVNAFLAKRPGINDVALRSELGKLLRAVSLEGEEIYSGMNDILNSTYVSLATGTYLDTLALDFLIHRKAATSATCDVQFEGVVGTVIPQGFLVQKNGTSQRYSTKNVLTISHETESNSVEVTATGIGSDYTAAFGQITEFAQNPPQGLVSCINISQTVGGTDEETDEQLRQRIRTRLQFLAAGTEGAVVAAALNVPGVRYATYQANFPVFGTDTLAICDDFGRLYPELATVVANAVATYRSAGRKHLLAPATLANLFVEASVALNIGYTTVSTSKNFDQAIRQYVGSNYTFGSEIYPDDLKREVVGLRYYNYLRVNIAIDPRNIPGIAISNYTYRGSEPSNKITLAAYFYRSTNYLIIGNTSISVEADGAVDIVFASGEIASLQITISTAYLPTHDATDTLTFLSTTNKGVQLLATHLPILRTTAITENTGSLINAG